MLDCGIPIRHGIHDRSIEQYHLGSVSRCSLRLERTVDKPHRGVVGMLSEQRDTLLYRKLPERWDGSNADAFALK